MIMSGSVTTSRPPSTARRQAVDLTSGTFVGPGGASTSVVTRIPVSNTNVTLLVANVNRIGATIYNQSPGSRELFLKLGANANIGPGTESFTVRIDFNGFYEVPFGYIGIIDGIWNDSDSDGEALVTEVIA